MLTDEEIARALDTAVAQGEQLARFFHYGHLPEKLQPASKPWAALAVHVLTNISRSAERTVALRKLLEGKDCAVRATLPVNP